MITLSNGAEVQMAFILPKSPGMKPHGIVLAKTSRERPEWVTWDIYQNDDRETEEEWGAESGHYFDVHDTAQFDFGLRLRYLLPAATRRGMK